MYEEERKGEKGEGELGAFLERVSCELARSLGHWVRVVAQRRVRRGSGAPFRKGRASVAPMLQQALAYNIIPSLTPASSWRLRTGVARAVVRVCWAVLSLEYF